jgi:hypothetical protein
MDPIEARLSEKLRRIEALFAGATTDGERVAAEEAAKRVKAKLEETKKLDPPIEFRFAFNDPWSRKLFLALARRYGLDPYRMRGQRYATVMVRAPEKFVKQTLWPEFQELQDTLVEHLNAVADRILKQVVNPDTAEAKEVDAPRQLSSGG